MGELGEDSWVDRDPERKIENLLIGMFHSQTLPHKKNRVRSSLSGQGSCRVVVATTALGMGLHFPNISHIFELNYVTHNLPVFKLEHAKEIIRILDEVFDDIEQSHTTLFTDSVVQVDMDYTGYFDEDHEDDHIQSSPGSLESGLSVLKISD